MIRKKNIVNMSQSQMSALAAGVGNTSMLVIVHVQGIWRGESLRGNRRKGFMAGRYVGIEIYGIGRFPFRRKTHVRNILAEPMF